MNRRTIYLAGGCYWGVQRFMDNVRGVLETEVGFANGHVSAPTYAQVKHGDTGHAETVRVAYDAETLPLRAPLKMFFRIIDPTSLNRQGEDAGEQYRTGVYWTDEADAPVVQAALAELQAGLNAPVVVQALPLDTFWPAEEYHQKYLEKTPGGYCHVPLGLMQWARETDPNSL